MRTSNGSERTDLGTTRPLVDPLNAEHAWVMMRGRIDQYLGPDFRRVRLGIGHPGHKDRVHGYVLGNFAKAEIDPLTDMLAAVSAEADWLARGDDARFMSDVALRLQDR